MNNNESIANSIRNFTVTQANLRIPIMEFKEKIRSLSPEGTKWNPTEEWLYVLIGKESSDFRINEKGTFKADISSLIRNYVTSFQMVAWNR